MPSRHSKHARRQPVAPRRHRRDVDPTADRVRGAALASQQPLIQEFRAALRGDPLTFPLAMSTFVAAAETAEGAANLSMLVETFEQIEVAETTAALHVVGALLDGPLGESARRIALTRRHPVPLAVSGLAGARVYEAHQMGHALDDGDDIVLGVRWPGVGELTLLCYVDHNLGTVVKDAFLAHAPVTKIVAELRDLSADTAGIEFSELGLADARAKLDQAVAQGRRLTPEPTSETWPMCRPVLEKLLGAMPSGGEGYAVTESSDAQRARVLADFLDSPHAVGLDRRPGSEEASRADVAFLCAATAGHRDPLHWSPVTVEFALTHWFVHGVEAGPDDLRGLPETLRRVIPYAHEVRHVPSSLTQETLAAVDQWDPVFHDLLQNGPSQPDGLLDELLVDSDAFFGDLLGQFRDRELGHVTRQVGGEQTLARLDSRPLPDEEFRWESIPLDVHPRVGEIVSALDAFADATFGVEFRTACRRFLAEAVASDPQLVRGRGRSDTAAAAVAWAVGKANDLVAGRAFFGAVGMPAKDLAASFGVNGSPSSRAQGFLRALGIADDVTVDGVFALGRPDFLIGEVRGELRARSRT